MKKQQQTSEIKDADSGYTFRLNTNTRTNYDGNQIEMEHIEEYESLSGDDNQ